MSIHAVAKPDFEALFASLLGLYMVLDPNLRVVAATDAYLQATMTRRAGIVGRHVFEVFPDNPDDPSADAVCNSAAPQAVGRRRAARPPASWVGGSPFGTARTWLPGGARFIVGVGHGGPQFTRRCLYLPARLRTMVPRRTQPVSWPHHSSTVYQLG
jgi:hypothetical protein